MTVNELLAKLSAAFSLFTPHAAAVWGPVYRASLGGHEGPVLAKAFQECLQAFEATPRKGYPSPKDFAAYLPARSLILAADVVKLDYRARADRVRDMLTEWRANQGHRAANGAREILRALEVVAEPLAGLAAWKPSGEPLRLTRGQVRTAQHRAISQERHRLHGKMPKKGPEWWAQIEGVCAGWKIPAVYDEWAASKKEAA